MARPAAILLMPEVPYPTVGGGASRAAALLEYLAARYELDVIVFRQPGAPDPIRTRLGELALRTGVIDLPVHASHIAARAARNLARLLRGVPPLTDRFAGFAATVEDFVRDRSYELAAVDHFWCAGYVDALAPRAERTLLDLHNIESVLHERCAESEPWPLSAAHRKFGRACARLEREWLPRYSLILAASREDAERIRPLARDARVTVYPNTIPATATPERHEEDIVTFSANMEFHPNSDAVRHFHRRIWPLLRARWPNLVWELVGMNPGAVRRYVDGDATVRLRGPVDDAVCELARAKVAVVPVRAGSGTRVKILEAWAAGTAVVSTRLGAEGLRATHDAELLMADEPEEFAEAVSSLLASPALRQRIGRAGRHLYEREYTWEAGWGTLEDAGI